MIIIYDLGYEDDISRGKNLHLWWLGVNMHSNKVLKHFCFGSVWYRNSLSGTVNARLGQDDYPLKMQKTRHLRIPCRKQLRLGNFSEMA